MLALQRELSTAIAEQVRLTLSPERLRALDRRQTRTLKHSISTCMGVTSGNNSVRPRPGKRSNFHPRHGSGLKTTLSPGPGLPTVTPPVPSMATHRHSFSGRSAREATARALRPSRTWLRSRLPWLAQVLAGLGVDRRRNRLPQSH